MSAAAALKVARAVGITIAVDGGDLILEAAIAPPPSVIERLAHHKADIVALLRCQDDGWSAADWRACFDERAAILGFEGGLTRAEAEARAFACCVAKWMNNPPASSASEYCLGCGAPDQKDDPVQPFGGAWLHLRCWPDWYAKRKAEAVAALKAIGITPEVEVAE
jgi:hypothetical protein